MIEKRCRWCGKLFATKDRRRLYCSKSCRRDAAGNNTHEDEQLCWTCKNTNGDICPWFAKDAKPVEGWVAKPTLIKYKEEQIPSYHIKECPNYIEERKQIKCL